MVGGGIPMDASIIEWSSRVLKYLKVNSLVVTHTYSQTLGERACCIIFTSYKHLGLYRYTTIRFTNQQLSAFVLV